MTKRLVDIEDDPLLQARQALGTETIKDTVATALRHAVRGGERRSRLGEVALQRFAAATEDLSDDTVITAAWR